MTIPSDPDTVINPRENFSPYPALIRAGIMMEPMATTVAGEEPEMAAKKMQARMPAMASPPGNQPTRALTKAMSFLAIPPRVMMSPARMKKGMARSINLSRALKSCWVMICKGVLENKMMEIMVVSPRMTAMGTPINKNPAKRMQMVSIT